MERVDDNGDPGAVGVYHHYKQRATEKAGQQSKNNGTGAQREAETLGPMASASQPALGFWESSLLLYNR